MVVSIEGCTCARDDVTAATCVLLNDHVGRAAVRPKTGGAASICHGS